MYVTAKKDYGRAILEMNEAIRRAPKARAFYYIVRSQAYSENGDYARALADIDQVVQLDPTEIYQLVSREAIRFKSGDVDGAIANLEALRATQENAGAYFHLGQMYASKGNHERALANYNELFLKMGASGSNSDTATVLIARADSYEALGRFDEAVADYRKAAGLDPNLKGGSDGVVRIENRKRAGAVMSAATVLVRSADRDVVQAYRLFDTAAALFPAGAEREAAESARDEVALLMTPDQLAAARHGSQ